jgi:hypothetical protein
MCVVWLNSGPFLLGARDSFAFAFALETSYYTGSIHKAVQLNAPPHQPKNLTHLSPPYRLIYTSGKLPGLLFSTDVEEEETTRFFLSFLGISQPPTPGDKT